MTIISCVEKENISSQVIVDLNVNTIDNRLPKSMNPLGYMDSIPEGFKGIINRDSSFVMYLNTVSSRDLKNALKEGKLKQVTIDLVKTKIYALSGYNKGKQYYVLDLNGNKDFSDDEIVEFDKGISDNENYRDYFNINTIEISKLAGDNFYKQLTYLQFFPVPNYVTYKQETEKEKFKHSLQLIALKHDFLFGTFEVDNKKYGVGTNKGWYGYEFIFKKSDTSFYSPNHQLFAKFLLKDTVKLNDKYFRIDSLSTFPPKLTMDEVYVDGEVYGFRTNEISKNYQIKNLNGDMTRLKDLAKEKGFLLLDFWGTWCAPCKELTPQFGRVTPKI